MSEYQYTTVPGKMKTLLTKIREIGVPPKATHQWIKSIGFKSSNDPSLLTILRFIGFINSSGIPTEIWHNYRSPKHGQVLANSIREGYSELFSVYPDAHSRNASELEHVFSTSSKAGKQVITKTIRTFQKLCDEADFTAIGDIQLPPAPATVSPETVPIAGGSTGVPSLHIDIQVHISPDATPEQIDKIFESMAKHLYKK